MQEVIRSSEMLPEITVLLPYVVGLLGLATVRFIPHRPNEVEMIIQDETPNGEGVKVIQGKKNPVVVVKEGGRAYVTLLYPNGERVEVQIDDYYWREERPEHMAGGVVRIRDEAGNEVARYNLQTSGEIVETEAGLVKWEID